MNNTKTILDARTCEQLALVNTQRAATYRLLASLVDREVSSSTYAALAGLADVAVPADAQECERSCAEGLRSMGRCLGNFDKDVENLLACDFARVFLASGLYNDHAAVPYESIYTSEEHILMQESRDQVKKLYMEAGVMPQRDSNIPEDYLPFEFEYMALLADRMADALTRGSVAEAEAAAELQEAFLRDHLLVWDDALVEDIDRIAQTPFYHALASTISGFLACEEQDVPELREACCEPSAA